jgi:hypothetical protein
VQTETKDFLLGADPEFVFVDKEVKIVPAYDILFGGNRNRAHNAARNGAALGCDAHPEVAELRPAPGTPRDLVFSLALILEDKYQSLGLSNDIRWVAGSFIDGEPIGAHIHFDTPFKPHYAEALDGILSQVVTVWEDPTQARARRGSNYGQLACMDNDAIRWPTGNRTQRFEYRSLGSFIVSPSISLGIFALAKAIIWEEVNKGRQRIRRLKRKQLGVINVNTRKYIQADREHFLGLQDDLWSIIRKYSYWKTPEGKSLWRYAYALKSNAHRYPHWGNGQDLLKRWKLVDEVRKIHQVEYKLVPIPQQFETEDVAWTTIATALNMQTLTEFVAQQTTITTNTLITWDVAI